MYFICLKKPEMSIKKTGKMSETGNKKGKHGKHNGKSLETAKNNHINQKTMGTYH